MKNWMIYLLIISGLFCFGCAKKEIPLDQIRILSAAKTAIAIKSQKQIKTCYAELDKKAQGGVLDSALDQDLREILQLAEKEKWNEAEKQIQKLQKQYQLER